MKKLSTLFCSAFAFCISISITADAQVDINDSLILVDLYNSTGGPSWTRHDNWLTGPVKSWYGIRAIDNRVTTISLGNNQLSGDIPPELGNLSDLRRLFLNDNQLSGSIPPELGNLSKLTGLFLSNNQLSGHIPSELGNLSSLNRLLLDNNHLNGHIPSNLTRLSKLTVLYLNYNQLNGHIPGTIGKLKNLHVLLLDHNKLSDSIPSSVAKLDLKALDLSRNRFTFDGMELVVQTFVRIGYDHQANIPVHTNKKTLSVSAGGTLANNIYKWHKAGEPLKTITIEGDSVFHPAESGVYYVIVNNKIATELNLNSDTITYVAPALHNAVSSNSRQAISNKSFSVYPNPTKDMLHVCINGNASFSLLDQYGKTLLTTTINNAGSINVSGIAAGVYYLRNNSTTAVEKIYIIK